MEVQLLKNDILRKDQGSILISGHRGVGKTSLVYKALQEVYKETQGTKHHAGKQLLLVLINAGQLDTSFADKAIHTNPELILRTIIRRLYATAKSIDIGRHRKDLEDLYKKAVAKEFRLQEQYLQHREWEQSIEQKKDRQFRLKDMNTAALIHILSFLAGGAVLYLNVLANTWFNKLLGLLLVMPVPALINWSVSKLTVRREQNNRSQSAESIYQMDNNVSNLEFDLEELHKKLNNDNWKIVYVIDELDKLGDISNVVKVIKYFKNLFTLSKAVFLFIGNEDIYKNAILEQEGDNFRPEQYTYFTSKYFIARPNWTELVDFMEKSMAEQPDQLRDRQLIRLHYYLAQVAGNDFFSLINLIKDNICEYDEQGCPVLSIDMNNPDYIKKSRFHKCQMELFNKKYYLKAPAKRYENEQLLRQLMKYTDGIINAQRQTEFADPPDASNAAAIRRDFNNLLCRMEVFTYTREERKLINEVEVAVRQYQYTGYFKDDLPDRLNIYSEYENRFLSLSDEYLQVLLPIVNWFHQSLEADYTVERLRKEMEEGRPWAEVLPFDWLYPDSSWQETITMLAQDATSGMLSRSQIETQVKLLEEKKAQVNNSLFTLTVQMVRKELADMYPVEPHRNKFSMSVSNLYGKEMISALENGELAIFYSALYRMYHILIRPNIDFIQQLAGINEDENRLYLVASSQKEIDNLQGLPKSYKYYVVHDTNDLPSKIRSLVHDIKEVQPATNVDGIVKLSQRETDFLKLVCTELTYQEIAERMYLSPRTIEGYRDALFAKLGIKSRVGLALHAINTGLVSLD
jgi:DNA-binding CsgD family transcriptional regulator/Cdc6-like AAA superfamily ATPase